MKLSLLFPDINHSQDMDILEITNDSREVHAQTLFIAYTGFEKDLHQYIDDAYQNGCRYFLIDESKNHQFHYADALFIPSTNLKKEAARVALKFYDYPDKDLYIIGITGTNGKTTTSMLIDQALNNLGYQTAFFGTVEWKIGLEKFEALNTTPDLLELVKFLRQAVDNNIKFVVMEVASHALSMGRVENISFDVAAFTNLTQDHLDYHGDFEHYFNAKKYLFTDILVQSSKIKKKAFINTDDEYGQRLSHILEKQGVDFESLSLYGKGSYDVDLVEQTIESTKFIIHHQGQDIRIESSLIGLFNIYNFTMAYMILSHIGIDSQLLLKALHNISIPGRFQKYVSPNNMTFLIDYAHTPDALDKAVTAIHQTLSFHQKLIVVFGAGGDRDKTKRPLMAQAASKGDIVIVTSDNPRTEDPQKIIDDIMTGFDPNQTSVYQEINRSHAIALAYQLAKSGDVILLAGKGHEEYQIIGKKKYYFSDLEEIKKVAK
ncbi:MAG: UDP-N-acetylmuramoyl-L-alanyl-D-glutamate--2,6-diaminopimelate ligase [Brevinema sp.]